MNVHMYENPITQDNMARLRAFGISFIEPDAGYLACGEVGKGRLPEPELIVSRVLEALDAPALTSEPQVLAGKRVMITAGPTVEAIDPVRYITNRSSGKFGYALAETAARKAPRSRSVSGPVALPEPEGVEVSTLNRRAICSKQQRLSSEACDVGIFAAAVADVRPAKRWIASSRRASTMLSWPNIALVENPDVLATLGNAKTRPDRGGFCRRKPTMSSTMRARNSSRRMPI